jgi:ATP-binding cassette subfamily F protein 3
MVSHDRYLIEACADRLWVVADQAVTSYDGDLDDYRRLVLSSRGERAGPREAGERNAIREKSEREKSERRNERQKAPKQRIAEAETEIERINAIIAKIDAALALPDIFTRDPKQAAQLSQARANAADALARAEEEWLDASAQVDQAAG